MNKVNAVRFGALQASTYNVTTTPNNQVIVTAQGSVVEDPQKKPFSYALTYKERPDQTAEIGIVRICNPGDTIWGRTFKLDKDRKLQNPDKTLNADVKADINDFYKQAFRVVRLVGQATQKQIKRLPEPVAAKLDDQTRRLVTSALEQIFPQA